jgi:agmatine deiminase
MPVPAELGFRMPAEWEPHHATWIAWPHERSDWPGKFETIPWLYAEIVRQLHLAEHVHILVSDARAERKARAILRHSLLDWDRVHFHRIPTNRVWTRDYGPIFVVSPERELAATTWGFNAWAKYDDFEHDAEAASRIVAAVGCRSWRAMVGDRPIVLEGGSIDVDGRGHLLTTEECLLSPIQERNPGMSRPEIEAVLHDYLGARRILWLGRGLVGDDTHGHIDDLARFVAPGRIVAVLTDDADDENYTALQENLERLQGMTDLDGRHFEIVTLPLPDPVVFDGHRLPASYANFYLANDRVLVPTFHAPQDRLALGILAELFPGRQVIGIHAVDLVWGLGTLHCLTQQQPGATTPSGSLTTAKTRPSDDP